MGEAFDYIISHMDYRSSVLDDEDNEELWLEEKEYRDKVKELVWDSPKGEEAYEYDEDWEIYSRIAEIMNNLMLKELDNIDVYYFSKFLPFCDKDTEVQNILNLIHSLNSRLYDILSSYVDENGRKHFYPSEIERFIPMAMFLDNEEIKNSYLRLKELDEKRNKIKNELDEEVEKRVMEWKKRISEYT